METEIRRLMGHLSEYLLLLVQKSNKKPLFFSERVFEAPTVCLTTY